MPIIQVRIHIICKIIQKQKAQVYVQHKHSYALKEENIAPFRLPLKGVNHTKKLIKYCQVTLF